MSASRTAQEILHEVNGLPPDMQRRVLHFARSLAQPQREGTPGRDLLRFAGAIPLDDLRVMSEVIEAEFEQGEPVAQQRSDYAHKTEA